MQEITISGRKKINLGNYESQDIMASAKITLLDGTDIETEMEKANQKINTFLEKEEKKIRETKTNETKKE